MNKYITDEFSRKVWIFIIKYKSDVTDKVIQWHKYVTVYFWEFAILTAVYLRNKCITSVSKSKTPDEIFSGKKPYIKHLKVFGCDAFKV